MPVVFAVIGAAFFFLAERVRRRTRRAKREALEERRALVRDELRTRRMEHAIKPHEIPGNPYRK